MKKLPAEIVASALAVTTIFIGMWFHLPPWAIFITWAGTFAAGGPTAAVLRKIWPAMIVGGFFACAIVMGFKLASQYFTGTSYIVAECVILFTLNATMMSLARFVPALSFIPGMFFGFASFFATYFGKFGPVPGDPLFALAASVAMNALGPIYAWITATFGAHHHAPDDSRESAQVRVRKAVS